jgi:class 3 adenylate cyclase
MRMAADVLDVLGTVRVPTLVLHRASQREQARFIAGRIPGAKALERPGIDGYLWADPDTSEHWARSMQEFVARVRAGEGADRVLATILFTDLVDSTAHAVRLGDAAWRDLTARHHALVRSLLSRYRGEEQDTAGDGFFASFDGPGRAIECAVAIRDGVRELGLDVRAGLHTGECERTNNKLAGIAVVTGARVVELAGAAEVLVTSTVKDLVAGSGIEFEPRGTHVLKGIPGEWQLYAVR